MNRQRKVPLYVDCERCNGRGVIETSPNWFRRCLGCMGLGRVANPKAIQK